jgi:hypothetical protein
MPYCLTSAHWRAQYAADVYCRTDVLINAIKTTSNPEDDLHYCPAWTAENKKGWPKKNICQTSVIDLIEESSSNKRKRRRKMFCNIFQRFNHTTETDLRILQINCRLWERHRRVRFRKELWTRICVKKGCDIFMLNVARCDIVMVYF